MDSLKPGQQLMGRYELVRPIGTGLGGETWEAKGPSGAVAIKVVREGDVGAGAFDDLIREAGLLRGLTHPGVVAYREFADRPDLGCAFLVMELVVGGDLFRHLRRNGAYSARNTARLGLQLVDALEAIHGRGVLHRDLKPSNVLVADDRPGLPVLRVADFGISRRTRDGQVETIDAKLTPSFAAPEQFRRGALTTAVDVYALAGVLVSIATGTPPDGDLSRNPEAVDLSCTSADGSAGDNAGRADLASLLGQMVRFEPADRLALAGVRRGLRALADGRALELDAIDASMSGVTTDHFLSTVADVEGSAEPPPPGPVGLLGPALVKVLAVVGLVLAGLAFWDAVHDSPPVEDVPVVRVSEPVEPLAVAVESVKRAPFSVPVSALVVAPVVAPPVAPRSASLKINTQPWSNVSIDGVAVGRTKMGGARFEVPAGRHLIVLESEDGSRYSKHISLAPGEVGSLCVKLRTGLETACR